MMRAILLFALGFAAAVAAVPRNPQRIVGGYVTTIDQYPHIVALLHSWNHSSFVLSCGGTIINNRCILTAANCVVGDTVSMWRVRVGSSFSNSGGVVQNFVSFGINSSFNRNTRENDIAVLRTAAIISFNNNVRPALIAGTNHLVPDNQLVWAVGWGNTFVGGSNSEQLRHVQVWTINQNVCATRYEELNRTVTPEMLCSGWLDVGGRDQCHGDDGGPLYYNGAVVGISSWAESCALPRYPRINTRVSLFTTWIQRNSEI